MPAYYPHHGLRGKQYQEVFGRLLALQHNMCALCGKEHLSSTTDLCYGKRGLVKLTIDHCHNTGKIRGLLCTPCNSSLPVNDWGISKYAEWAPERARRIREYLQNDYGTYTQPLSEEQQRAGSIRALTARVQRYQQYREHVTHEGERAFLAKQLERTQAHLAWLDPQYVSPLSEEQARAYTLQRLAGLERLYQRRLEQTTDEAARQPFRRATRTDSSTA